MPFDNAFERGRHGSKPFPVQHTEEQPSSHLQFVLVDGRLVLHQRWDIFEWGNSEGLGIPMNERTEWRAVQVGTFDPVSGEKQS